MHAQLWPSEFVSADTNSSCRSSSLLQACATAAVVVFDIAVVLRYLATTKLLIRPLPKITQPPLSNGTDRQESLKAKEPNSAFKYEQLS